MKTLSVVNVVLNLVLIAGVIFLAITIEGLRTHSNEQIHKLEDDFNDQTRKLSDEISVAFTRIGHIEKNSVMPRSKANTDRTQPYGRQVDEGRPELQDPRLAMWIQVKNLSPELSRRSTFMNEARETRLKFSAADVTIVGWKMIPHSSKKEGAGKYKIDFHVYPLLKATDGTSPETDGFIRETWSCEVAKGLEGWAFLHMTGIMPAKRLFLNGKEIRTLAQQADADQ